MLVFTRAGRFLDQFSVARALDRSAVGAGSTQQGVHSHSDIFHQIKLGAVCLWSRPDSLPIQKHNPVIQIRWFPRETIRLCFPVYVCIQSCLSVSPVWKQIWYLSYLLENFMPWSVQASWENILPAINALVYHTTMRKIIVVVVISVFVIITMTHHCVRPQHLSETSPFVILTVLSQRHTGRPGEFWSILLCNDITFV